MLPFHPEAGAELEAAVTWLEEEQPGHGDLLFNDVSKKVAQATAFPESGAPVHGFDARNDVRAYTLGRFRYRVITAVVSGSPAVVAVARTACLHQARASLCPLRRATDRAQSRAHCGRGHRDARSRDRTRDPRSPLWHAATRSLSVAMDER